jgi:dihydroflavonol-4-reductase
MGMRVLVTGSTGFIGAALCRALLAEGHEVRAFHRATSNLRLLADLPVEHALGDLLKPESLLPAMAGVQAVFHSAALLGGAGGNDPGRYYAVTVEGTRAVMQAALEAGVERVVHTSSAAALGVPQSGGPRWLAPALMAESHTWNYRADYWPYGYAKYLAEMEVQRAVAAGLDAVIVNPSVVVGAGDVYRQTSSVVVQLARRRLPAAVEGGLNVIHLADVVSGHLAAWQRGRSGERYLLSAENLPIEEYLRRAAAVIGAPAPRVILPAGVARALARPYRWAEGLIRLPVNASMLHLAGMDFYFDNRKARLDLDWSIRHSLEEAVREAYDWFQAAGAL